MKRYAIRFSDHVVIIAEDKGEEAKGKRSRTMSYAHQIHLTGSGSAPFVLKVHLPKVSVKK